MKRSLHMSLAAVLLAMLLLSACAAQAPAADASAEAPAETGTQYITKEALKAAMDAGEAGYVLLDVRKAADYAASHIQGAYSADVDATISNSDDETSLANLKAAVAAATGAETGNGDEKFVLICYSGKKYAEAATNLLQQMGVAAGSLYTLEGGQNGWAEAGDEYVALLESGEGAAAPEAEAEAPAAAVTPAVDASEKLITPDEVEALIAQGAKVFDLRGAEDYEAGHIPGAMNINNKQFENPDNPVDGEIATAEQFEALMSSYGITPEDVIITYASASKPQMAPRLIWTLEAFGHTATYLLDGQYEAWAAAGKATETGASPAVEAAEYKVISTENDINVDKDYVINLPEGAVLLDCRPVADYSGEAVADGNARGGHIPGAVDVYYMDAVDENGFFRSVEELTQLYASVGVTPDKEIVTYCQRGHRASHTWFALTYILGFENVKVYDGSMMEWSNLEDQPIETEVAEGSVGALGDAAATAAAGDTCE